MKRALPSSLRADSPENVNTEITAKGLVEKQGVSQRRRRGVAGGRGSSTRTSLWSTIAASVQREEGQYKFHCVTCNYIGSMNRTMSTSNVTKHYEIRHASLRNSLISMNESNATEAMLNASIDAERARLARDKNSSNTTQFFSRRGSSATRISEEECEFPEKTLQAVGIIVFCCETELSTSRIASTSLQGLVDIFGGRVQFASKYLTEKLFFDTHAAICRILQSSVTKAKTGCITVNGWSSVLGAPILGMTWHYIDISWNMRCVPIATLNMGTASKTGRQLSSVIEEVLSQNQIVGSEDICMHTATSENEAEMALAVDLLTKYVCYVRCVVHTLELCVNDVFEAGTV